MAKASTWAKEHRLKMFQEYAGAALPPELYAAMLKNLSGDVLSGLKAWAHGLTKQKKATPPEMGDDELKTKALGKMTAVEMALALVDQSKPWGAVRTRIELNPLQMLEFASKFETYNSIKNLPEMVEAIVLAVPASHELVTHHYEVGNEGSLVVYVTLHRYVGGTNWDLVASRVVLAGRNAGCQEASAEPPNPITSRQRIRLWWS